MTLFNRVKQTTATTGTGTITLGSAVDGYQTYAAAGATDGQTVNYVLEDGSAWEYGSGTYSSTGPTISRDNIEESSNGGAAIDLSGSAVVFCDAFAGDFGGLVRHVATAPVTTPVAAVEIADLDWSQFREFRVYCYGIAFATAGSTIMECRVSYDSGSTFAATGYKGKLVAQVPSSVVGGALSVDPTDYAPFGITGGPSGGVSVRLEGHFILRSDTLIVPSTVLATCLMDTDDYTPQFENIGASLLPSAEPDAIQLTNTRSDWQSGVTFAVYGVAK